TSVAIGVLAVCTGPEWPFRYQAPALVSLVTRLRLVTHCPRGSASPDQTGDAAPLRAGAASQAVPYQAEPGHLTPSAWSQASIGFTFSGSMSKSLIACRTSAGFFSPAFAKR